jgi:DNA gyrase subunit A
VPTGIANDGKGGEAASMARKSDPPAGDRVIDIDVDDEMRTSFLEYAYSVIYARALPDARDGLKPVQRRIVFQMSEMGLRPDRGHVKSARVVGEVMGRLHPHGDSAIYDALVRLAQPFTLRLPLIDGHGNFGSPDDGPAAMRYTECRLAPAAVSLAADIDEDVVDFVPNYDGREQEPTVLPAGFPALLVNGAAGIAVGMATSMPPHNLGEVVAAARHLVLNPDATLDDLIRFVPGPDLPGGGLILGLDGVREAYATGRGSFRVRATTRIEQVSPRRRGIVVTELPLGVGPERVTERIKDLVNAKKLTGISDLIDLTDGESGLRLVIELAPSVNPEAMLEQLHRLTPLEEAFTVNAVALVDGEPRTLGLKELLAVFVDHRRDVVRRRSLFRRARAQERQHLVDGLLIAIIDIDEVIELIRSSDDAAGARERLMSVFDLSHEQATYILDMPLRRLTRFSRIELETEREELVSRIEELTLVIDDEARLRAVVAEELLAVGEAHATPRRTILLEDGGDQRRAASTPLEIPDSPCRVLVSGTGLIARTSGSEVAADGPRASHDVIVSATMATARGEIALMTSLGRAVRLPVVELPVLPDSAHAPALGGGAPLGALVDLADSERIIGIVEVSDPPAVALLGTRQGIVKRTPVQGPPTKSAWDLMTLEPGDELVGAAESTNDDDIVIVTSDGQGLRFPATSVRPQGRAAGGMAGIRLAAGAEVVFCGSVDPDPDALLVTVAGSRSALPGTSASTVKVSLLADVPRKGRGTSGVRVHRFLRGEDTVVLAWAGAGPLRACGASGTPLDLPAGLDKRDASGHLVAGPVASVAGPPR